MSETVTAELVLQVLKRSPIVNNDDKTRCAGCEVVECPDWCIRASRKALSLRWFKYFR
jgi:Pyruvate/2-oxoacid:ferredoxin oxidoreductase delta subunit